MNKLSIEKRKAVIAALVEGNSINSTSRMTGVSKPTILKLLVRLGTACVSYHDDHVRGLTLARVECDEIWAFVHCKQKRVAMAKAAVPGAGGCWTWTAIDPDTKLILTWHVALRTPEDARGFMLDLAGRITNLPQLTTDGLGVYPEAVWNAFGDKVDFAQLIKLYTTEPASEARDSPPECVGYKKTPVIGCPKYDNISVPIVERSNLTVRMSMRRFTRLTTGHNQKIENHMAAISLFFTYYNFCRIHRTLGMTSAMAAGLTDRVWGIEDLIGLLD